MLGDLSIDYCLPDFFQLCERPGFVIAHQPAVADDIGGKNCSETAFHRGGIKALKEESRMLTRESNRFNGSTFHRISLYRFVRITSGNEDDCVAGRNRNRTSPIGPFRDLAWAGIVPAGPEPRQYLPAMSSCRRRYTARRGHPGRSPGRGPSIPGRDLFSPAQTRHMSQSAPASNPRGEEQVHVPPARRLFELHFSHPANDLTTCRWQQEAMAPGNRPAVFTRRAQKARRRDRRYPVRSLSGRRNSALRRNRDQGPAPSRTQSWPLRTFLRRRVPLRARRALPRDLGRAKGPFRWWPKPRPYRPSRDTSCRGRNRNRPFRHKPGHTSGPTRLPWQTFAAPIEDNVWNAGSENLCLSNNTCKLQCYPWERGRWISVLEDEA